VRLVSAHLVRAIALAASVVALAACGGSNSFPASARASFTGACEKGAPASICNCMFDYIQAHVSLDKFKASLADLKAGRAPSYVVAAANSCRSNSGTTT
jgi:hypothetical protein